MFTLDMAAQRGKSEVMKIGSCKGLQNSAQ